MKAASDPTTPRRSFPWITGLLIVASTAVYLLNSFYPEAAAVDSWLGVASAREIWGGSYGRLVSNAFVHLTLWHIATNSLLLGLFGSRIEGAIGSLRYFAFIIAAAATTIGCNLVASGVTAHGMSGVVCACYAFMWSARARYACFRVFTTPVIAAVSSFGLIAAGLFANHFSDSHIASVGHITGFLFGVVVGQMWVRDA